MDLCRGFQIGLTLCVSLVISGLGGCSDRGIYNVAPPPNPSITRPMENAQARMAAAEAESAVDAAADAALDSAGLQSKVPAVAEPSPSAVATTQVPTEALLLAYTYNAALELPFRNVVSTMTAHRQKCENAGPSVCQIVGASSQGQGDDRIDAELRVRATPTWLATFRGGLENDAKAGDGKVVAQSVASEDLTFTIKDTEVRLRALRALRTRIEGLIASRPGKLSDLLEAERELARVQGEIDSFEGTLAINRARVTLSTMTLNYQTKPSAVAGGTFTPVSEAFTMFFSVLAQSLSVLIGLVAALIPFALVLGPLAYFGNKWRRRRKAAKLPPPPLGEVAP